MSKEARRKLQELSLEKIAPLEAHFKEEWPEVWREFARSCFATLLPVGFLDESQRVDIVLQLLRGFVADFGGLQYYIPVGAKSRRHALVLEMRARGVDYKTIARECCLAEGSVRRIEQEYRPTKVPLAQRIAFQQAKENS